MRKLKRLAAFALALAMVISMIPAMSLQANAVTTGISQTYPEATELLTNIGIMDNSTSAWTDTITATEANSVIQNTLYGPTIGWTVANVGLTEFAADETITGEKFMHQAIGSLARSTVMDATWISYFHLEKGLQGYSASSPITREQAAQILLNVFKANPGYNPAEIKGAILGIQYVKVKTDALGRPTYQWQRTGTPLTAEYADTPIAKIKGGMDWENILDAVGVTWDVTNAIGALGGPPYCAHMYYNISENGGAFTNYALQYHGAGAGTFYTDNWSIEIYDSYAMPSDGTFNCRAYNFLVYRNFLAKIVTESGVKNMYMFDYQTWGPWSAAAAACPAIDTSEDGFYIINHNGAVVNLRAAKVVAGQLKAFNVSAGTITYGETTKNYTAEFYYGRDLLVDGNIDKYYVFYVDDNDKILGMEPCSHSYGSWEKVSLSNHARTCSVCGYAESAAHDTEVRGYVAPTVAAVGYTGDTYCKVCNELIIQGQEIPKSTCTHTAGTPVTENVVTATCETPGSYESNVYCTVTGCGVLMSSQVVPVDALNHDWEETGRVPATDLENGAILYTCKRDANHTKQDTIPALKTGVTDYAEATELMTATELMDKDNQVWKQKLTAAEANEVLQALYDGPGFAATWAPNLADGDITGAQFIEKAIYTLGYGGFTGFSVEDWINYFHLEKGLLSDYSRVEALTREQTAQIVLNVLKSVPEYNPNTIKANDPGIGLTLVKASEDEMKRPSYKWQKAGVDITAVYADIPVVTMDGGADWEDIMDTVGLTAKYANIMLHGYFNWSENGGDFSDYVLQYHGAGAGAFKNTGWDLEIYDAYGYHSAVFAENGHTFTCKAYNIVCLGADPSGDDSDEDDSGDQDESGDIDIDDIETSYPQAVELMMGSGIMDKTNTDWTEKLTAAEANAALQKLYDAPGFAAAWAPNLADGDVTGAQLIEKAIYTLGYGAYNGFTTADWINYFHLEKDLLSGYSRSAALTREEAAQILLNVLKSEPEYNPKTIKANDPGLGISLVKVSEDEMNRPSYKWTKGGADITATYADTPVVILDGGTDWEDIMETVGMTMKYADVMLHGYFNWSENGGDFTDYVLQYRGAQAGIFKNIGWKLEIYDAYEYHTAVFEANGHTFTCKAYNILCLGADPVVDTLYPEAVELVSNTGFMNGANYDWKATLTGAEANQALQMLYNGPGFAAAWAPGFAADATVTGYEFMSKALVTIGWNYNNDKLFSKYNHLTVGLQEEYRSSKPLTREQAAQIVLNVLKTVPTYNNKTLKANDPAIGLTLVKVSEDEMNRPSYKWQKNGEDVTGVYQDSPVYSMQGGVSWSDILTNVGDVGEINIAAYFRWSKDGGNFTKFYKRQHPNYDIFKSSSTALEIYRDYETFKDGYSYNIITYTGKAPTNPTTGDLMDPVTVAFIGVFAAAAAFAMIVIDKKKKRA